MNGPVLDFYTSLLFGKYSENKNILKSSLLSSRSSTKEKTKNLNKEKKFYFKNLNSKTTKVSNSKKSLDLETEGWPYQFYDGTRGIDDWAQK